LFLGIGFESNAGKFSSGFAVCEWAGWDSVLVLLIFL
jgi:hypothetical protein